MLRANCGQWLAGLCLAASSIGAYAQQQWKIAGGFNTNWDEVIISNQQLSDSVYYLHGSGGNMVLSAGADGLLLVDDEFGEITDKIVAATNSIQPGPLRFVLNTHFHNDHTGGNAKLGENGSIIIAQEKSRERMLADSYSAYFNSVTPAPPVSALPLVGAAVALRAHRGQGS